MGASSCRSTALTAARSGTRGDHEQQEQKAREADDQAAWRALRVLHFPPQFEREALGALSAADPDEKFARIKDKHTGRS